MLKGAPASPVKKRMYASKRGFVVQGISSAGGVPDEWLESAWTGQCAPRPIALLSTTAHRACSGRRGGASSARNAHGASRPSSTPATAEHDPGGGDRRRLMAWPEDALEPVFIDKGVGVRRMMALGAVLG